MMPSVVHAENHHLVMLLQAAGECADITSVSNCIGGGNNRVFIIQADNKQLIAKWYFTHPSDTRDRLRAEYAFLEYAHGLGLSCVPKPLSCLPDERLALYEFIEGSKLQSSEVSAQHIGETAEFFLALNGAERLRLAGTLPDASEACFSIADQITSVQKRVARLSVIAPLTPEDTSALDFVGRIQNRLDAAVESIMTSTALANMNANAALKAELRCISPSDFGFHNVLKRLSGNLCFLDFEYAGWDDPAKMVCDFFCQPAVLVNPIYFEDFMRRSLSFSPASELLMSRARLMFPLFRIKWCCIMLNEFLPDSARRRQFANPHVDLSERKRTQLSKAVKFLELTTQET